MSTFSKFEEIKNFLLGATSGWAWNEPASSVSDLPGYREIRYAEGDFLVVERFAAVSDRKWVNLHFSVTVFIGDAPAWSLELGGRYEEHAIEFLKAAIRHAYANHVFAGGRGGNSEMGGAFVDSKKYPGLAYVNYVRDREGPLSTVGHEAIHDTVLGRIGCGNYITTQLFA